jgi:hypothetical protein
MLHMPTMPSADSSPGVRDDDSPLSHIPWPKGSLPRSAVIPSVHRRRIYKAQPDCGWRTARSRARSSRVYHTSYPVPVRHPARVAWASSRPHLAAGALALLLAFGSANTWREDVHLARSVPCLAHTLGISRARLYRASAALLCSAHSCSAPLGTTRNTGIREDTCSNSASGASL